MAVTALRDTATVDRLVRQFVALDHENLAVVVTEYAGSQEPGHAAPEHDCTLRAWHESPSSGLVVPTVSIFGATRLTERSTGRGDRLDTCPA
jgi:hypothetical protein